MKIIFLDIDGVLNSKRYDNLRTAEQGNIDETRLALLKGLVDDMQAKLVLISTWRKHWDADASLCDEVGRQLNALFGKYGMTIMDKTPELLAYDRPWEVRRWLREHEGEVESYVILDDIPWGWGELEERHVRTDFNVGWGLGEKHIQKARDILMR